MKKITFKASMLVIAGVFALSANAQQKPAGTKKFGKPFITSSNYCGAVENEALLRAKDGERGTTQEFEQWLAPKVAEIKLQNLQKDGQNTNAVVTIPVVFHIIHNGDAIGENENISEAQVLSQITTLNQDYRRAAGTPGFNDNPIGEDMEIEFCLAQRTPNGLPSNGIMRYNIGDEDGWVQEEVELVKPQTQWDPTKYLNIWVFEDIFTPGGYLAGYAQFPAQSTLLGFEGQSFTPNTDGVAIGARFIGSVDLNPEGLHDDVRNMGRTATHEIGHFFGLRHIWGDSNSCDTATDYCDDTPTALYANEGCDIGNDSCPDNDGLDMIENYMDYTDDLCLNTFTQDQKVRMQAVLTNSPRRKTLPTSNGCTLGTASLNNDGAIYLKPFDTNCSNAFAPVFTLQNTGSNTITAATVNYNVDNGTPVAYSWTGSIVPGEDARIILPEMGVPVGEHTFSMTLQTVNGVADALATNNTRTNDFSFEALENYDTTSVTVTVQTDESASEVTWLLMDSNQNVIAAGGMYEDAPGGVLDVQEDIPVDNNSCYAFVVIEQGGDGMPGGYYSIQAANGDVIYEGDGDTLDFVDFAGFSVNVVLGINKPVKTTNNIILYPNPANSVLNIASTDANMPESYTVYNSLGQVIDNGNVTSVLQTLDIAKYANGVYFVKLAKGEGSTTLQFIKR